MNYARSVAWFVYVARCADATLYVGIARDVAARIAAHDAGRGAKYTRGRGPLSVLATRRCATEGNALRLELALKALPREKKLALVASPEDFAAFAIACAARARRNAKLKAARSRTAIADPTTPRQGRPKSNRR
jgi:putative endonuclease